MFSSCTRAAHRAAPAPALVLVLATWLVTVLATSARAGFTPFSIDGNATPASIQTTLDAFRTAIGGSNNANNAGPLAGGRREINWDGGGAIVAAASGSTLTAFQNTRGATFTTPGTGFLQTPLNVAALTDINPTYATTFSALSPVRIFVPIASNITDTTFSLPGSGGATPATVSAFGAVFSDVDLANVTSLEFFDSANNSLAKLFVPPATVASGGFSFVGAVANAGERIARVRIVTGNAALGPNDNPAGGTDVVAMDDFLYAEPLAAPEPSTAYFALVAAQIAALLVRGRPGPRGDRRRLMRASKVMRA